MIRTCLLLSIICLNYLVCSSQFFSVKETKLLDANKKEFLIRGVNNPHIWHKNKSFRSLERIASLNANTIRIVWETKGKPGKLEKIIDKCLELKMIPMVELHDATGDTTTKRLLQLAAYYTHPDVKEMLLQYEKYLLLNIANEWGNHYTSSEYWRDSYMQAIDSIRKAGYRTTIVVDAGGWGQNHQPILDYGEKLLEYDPLHNLLFSVHMYGSWNNPEKIRIELQKIYDKGLPLIVGEFGYNYNSGDNNLKCMVNQGIILETCDKLEYGYIPWSWSGNNEENAWLDLADSNNWADLTEWGESVFKGECGITATAKRASVFDD